MLSFVRERESALLSQIETSEQHLGSKEGIHDTAGAKDTEPSELARKPGTIKQSTTETMRSL
jgi:hypothetical protein